MEENTPLLLEKQKVVKNASASNCNNNNANLSAVACNNSECETSFQKSEAEELQSLLNKAQTLLRNRSGDTSVGSFLPRWLIRYLLLISVIWQVLCIGVLSVVDWRTKNLSSYRTVKVVSNTILTIFTAVHLIVVILITMRVAAKVASHTATFSFLIQSYLSTVLLFSGLYTLSTRFQCRSFRHIAGKNENYCSSSEEVILITLFVKLLYFSVSNSTLCGITDIQPNEWYTDLGVAAQMLLSFLYFASILTQTYKKTGHDSIWETRPMLNKLRRWMIRMTA